MFPPDAVGDLSQQVHDFEPGIAPSGLFRTIPVASLAISVDPGSGHARLHADDVVVTDFHNALIAIGLQPPAAPLPSHVSFDVRWSGGGHRQKVRDETFGFTGQYVAGPSTVSFTASNSARRSRARRSATPALAVITRSSPSAPTPASCCTSGCARGSANTSRGLGRFLDELLARLERAGAAGPRLLRVDSGFWNNHTFDRLDRAGWQFWEAIDEQDWQTLEDYSKTSIAQIAETTLNDRRLVVRRVRTLNRQGQLLPTWELFPFVTNY